MHRKSIVRTVLGACLSAGLTLSLHGAALAQETEAPATDELEPPPPVQETIIVTEGLPRQVYLPNIAVEFGGGMQTFTGELGDVLTGGAGWGGRVIIGARSRFGTELGYLGAWNEAESTQTLDKTSANVYTNTAELLGRVNLFGTRAVFKPYGAVGVSYSRMDAAVSSPIGGFVLDNRDLFGIPLAAGIQFLPAENFTVSFRGNYTVLTDWIDEDVAGGDQWGGSLNLGAVF